MAGAADRKLVTKVRSGPRCDGRMMSRGPSRWEVTMAVPTRTQERDGVEYEVLDLGRDLLLGKVETDEGMIIVFRMNDATGPTEDDWNLVKCRLANLVKCAREIPRGTPRPRSREILDRCLERECGRGRGGGVVMVLS
ncbi:hypothetical protein [Microlunatus sp. GCM10028923]|uniref:hypothetical protein n=1 Tax=Microlunatus sp. GCM10028923 TaxID=3273400 RepID=UPI00361E499D